MSVLSKIVDQYSTLAGPPLTFGYFNYIGDYIIGDDIDSLIKIINLTTAQYLYDHFLKSKVNPRRFPLSLPELIARILKYSKYERRLARYAVVMYPHQISTEDMTTVIDLGYEEYCIQNPFFSDESIKPARAKFNEKNMKLRPLIPNAHIEHARRLIHTGRSYDYAMAMSHLSHRNANYFLTAQEYKDFVEVHGKDSYPLKMFAMYGRDTVANLMTVGLEAKDLITNIHIDGSELMKYLVENNEFQDLMLTVHRQVHLHPLVSRKFWHEAKKYLLNPEHEPICEYGRENVDFANCIDNHKFWSGMTQEIFDEIEANRNLTC